MHQLIRYGSMKISFIGLVFRTWCEAVKIHLLHQPLYCLMVYMYAVITELKHNSAVSIALLILRIDGTDFLHQITVFRFIRTLMIQPVIVS